MIETISEAIGPVRFRLKVLLFKSGRSGYALAHSIRKVLIAIKNVRACMRLILPLPADL